MLVVIQEERWLPLPGYKGRYLGSCFGRVFALKRGRFLKSVTTGTVTVSKRGIPRSLAVRHAAGPAAFP
jgi:hypothetical protein